MRSFDYCALANRSWPTDILNLVAIIHEYKGRQDMFVRQKPAALDRLVEMARIQSTEASNRIEAENGDYNLDRESIHLQEFQSSEDGCL